MSDPTFPTLNVLPFTLTGVSNICYLEKQFCIDNTATIYCSCHIPALILPFHYFHMNKLSLTSFVVLYKPTDKKHKSAASKDIEIQSSDSDTEDEQAEVGYIHVLENSF